MKIPGFTAEATLHKRSECYRQKEGDIPALRNGAGILPALRIDRLPPGRLKAKCTGAGGIWFAPSRSGVYGCVFSDGSGVFWAATRRAATLFPHLD